MLSVDLKLDALECVQACSLNTYVRTCLFACLMFKQFPVVSNLHQHVHLYISVSFSMYFCVYSTLSSVQSSFVEIHLVPNLL